MSSPPPPPSSTFPWRLLSDRAGLALLAALYLLPGLIGHEPWRGDDVRHIAIVQGMLNGEPLLFPHLAGEPASLFPPLYYWVSALLVLLTGWLLPVHDAARLATALFAALTVFWLTRASTRLNGLHTRVAAALLTLGTLGLVIHVHEAQPMVALMAMQAMCLAGLARVPTAPVKGGLQAACGASLAFLAAGPFGLLITLPLFLVCAVACPECRDPRASGGLILGLSLALGLSSLWPVTLSHLAPELLTLWWDEQWVGFMREVARIEALPAVLGQTGWSLWPLWPIALWTLWRARKQRGTQSILLPLAAFLLALAGMLAMGVFKPEWMLPLIAPLALLAAAGVPSLRRGAANAFDWFAVMTFSVFGILVWLAWSAQVIAWPPGLARSLARSAPDFVPGNAGLQALIGLLLCAVWLALVIRLPRTPDRGPVNWAMGMTMLWCLTVTLLMPWFDHDRNYRPLAESLSIALAGESSGCVAAMNLGNSHRAAFDYFAGIRTHSVDDNETSCRFLLVREDDFPMNIQPLWQWQQIWEDRHGGGKRLEVFRLYRRD